MMCKIFEAYNMINIADIFTKPLDRKLFKERDKLFGI